MSLLPRAGAGALARPLLASSRARAVPRAALPSNIRLRQKWAFEEHPPPAAYPLDYPGDLTDVREDREPDFEPIELPLLRPGETPSKDVQYNGYPDVAPVHARDKPDSQTRYWNAQFRQQWDEVVRTPCPLAAPARPAPPAGAHHSTNSFEWPPTAAPRARDHDYVGARSRAQQDSLGPAQAVGRHCRCGLHLLWPRRVHHAQEAGARPCTSKPARPALCLLLPASL